MGESKIPLYAYVDESGNTGKNIFDKTQPDYYTAAVITRGDFDLRFSGRVRAIAEKVGKTAIHANELGFGRLEQIAGDLFVLIVDADADFFVSRVEKRYLLATKMFDMLFDSGENAAVAWHQYNIKLLKLLGAFKLSLLIDDEVAKAFWNCLLMPKEDAARKALVPVCETMVSRLHLLPDQGSRDLIGRGLDWVIRHPDCVQFATEQAAAKKGHFPNLVAFSNLLRGLQHHSELLKRPVARITHDEQKEFGRVLESWHELFSNAAGGIIEWVGEKYMLRWAPGSQFVMKPDGESAGVQIADVALWLYGQHLKGKKLPPGCAALLALILERGWHNDFSFAGVEEQALEQWGEVMFGPVDQDKLDDAQKMLVMAEARRQASMAQYEKDGVPPFARPITVIENPAPSV